MKTAGDEDNDSASDEENLPVFWLDHKYKTFEWKFEKSSDMKTLQECTYTDKESQSTCKLSYRASI